MNEITNNTGQCESNCQYLSVVIMTMLDKSVVNEVFSVRQLHQENYKIQSLYRYKITNKCVKIVVRFIDAF
jgi:hypothetical protein